MEAREELCDPGGTGICAVNAEEKKTRRSLRGRRSSIKVVAEGSSPGVVVAPLSESILSNARINPTTQLINKRDTIAAYIGHLQAEKNDWENRIESRKQLWQRAKRIADRGLERRRMERIPVNELGRVDGMQKPRYTLNRIVRAFNKQNEDLYEQKSMNELLSRRTVLKDSLKEAKVKATSLNNLLKAESKTELQSLMQWWGNLKKTEEMRITRIQAKLARLEAQEATLNQTFCILSL
ncbi:hypothetical protein RB195_006675 [Necator americanus]|nr:hypothetical protein NECAME_03821 [Necator americanus]ETN75098.1 hypothetical protein NECAME_03821 [Necator americanus]